jgi:hypothetical protein
LTERTQPLPASIDHGPSAGARAADPLPRCPSLPECHRVRFRLNPRSVRDGRFLGGARHVRFAFGRVLDAENVADRH